MQSIQEIFFPKVHGFDGKDKQQLTDLFRWFVIYRQATRDLLARPTGSLFEIMLMLDLIQPAWFDYCTRDDVRALVHQTFTASFDGDFTDMIQSLKSKVWSLYLKEKYGNAVVSKYHAQNFSHTMTILTVRPSTIEKGQAKAARLSMPLPPGITSEWQHPLNTVYRWFVVYRELSGDYLPPAQGTRCEIVWMCELVKAAFMDLHFDRHKDDWFACFELPDAEHVAEWATQLHHTALHVAQVAS
jgi:hypothetical protein